MQQTNRKKILYITPALSGKTPLAVRLNIAQRTRLMKRLGHRVNLFTYQGAWSISGWHRLFHAIRKIDILMIRIDGSCIGDMYSLAKLLNPQMRVIWEIHGFPEENAPTNKLLFRHVIKKYQRLLLSHLVETCMYISDELLKFSLSRLRAKHHIVITNFVSARTSHFSGATSRLPKAIDKRVARKFVVLWGGSPQFPWQGIDIITKLGAYVEQIDPEVLFIMVGKNSWHKLVKSRNITQIDTLSRRAYRALLKRADVCIALYHKPPQTPLYFFPMKILDYMYHQRPVIASSFPVTASIITHGSDGFLVPNDIQEITYSIMKLKNNPALRKAVGKAARATIAGRFSDQQAMQAYKAVVG